MDHLPPIRRDLAVALAGDGGEAAAERDLELPFDPAVLAQEQARVLLLEHRLLALGHVADVGGLGDVERDEERVGADDARWQVVEGMIGLVVVEVDLAVARAQFDQDEGEEPAARAVECAATLCERTREDELGVELERAREREGDARAVALARGGRDARRHAEREADAPGADALEHDRVQRARERELVVRAGALADLVDHRGEGVVEAQLADEAGAQEVADLLPAQSEPEPDVRDRFVAIRDVRLEGEARHLPCGPGAGPYAVLDPVAELEPRLVAADLERQVGRVRDDVAAEHVVAVATLEEPERAVVQDAGQGAERGRVELADVFDRVAGGEAGHADRLLLPGPHVADAAVRLVDLDLPDVGARRELELALVLDARARIDRVDTLVELGLSALLVDPGGGDVGEQGRVEAGPGPVVIDHLPGVDEPEAEEVLTAESGEHLAQGGVAGLERERALELLAGLDIAAEESQRARALARDPADPWVEGAELVDYRERLLGAAEVEHQPRLREPGEERAGHLFDRRVVELESSAGLAAEREETREPGLERITPVLLLEERAQHGLLLLSAEGVHEVQGDDRLEAEPAVWVLTRALEQGFEQGVGQVERPLALRVLTDEGADILLGQAVKRQQALGRRLADDDRGGKRQLGVAGSFRALVDHLGADADAGQANEVRDDDRVLLAKQPAEPDHAAEVLHRGRVVFRARAAHRPGAREVQREEQVGDLGGVTADREQVGVERHRRLVDPGLGLEQERVVAGHVFAELGVFTQTLAHGDGFVVPLARRLAEVLEPRGGVARPVTERGQVVEVRAVAERPLPRAVVRPLGDLEESRRQRGRSYYDGSGCLAPAHRVHSEPEAHRENDEQRAACDHGPTMECLPGWGHRVVSFASRCVPGRSRDSRSSRRSTRASAMRLSPVEEPKSAVPLAWSASRSRTGERSSNKSCTRGVIARCSAVSSITAASQDRRSGRDCHARSQRPGSPSGSSRPASAAARSARARSAEGASAGRSPSSRRSMSRRLLMGSLQSVSATGAARAGSGSRR